MQGLPLPPTVHPIAVCENDTLQIELKADSTIANYRLLWFEKDTITGVSGVPIISGASLDSNDRFFVVFYKPEHEVFFKLHQGLA